MQRYSCLLVKHHGKIPLWQLKAIHQTLGKNRDEEAWLAMSMVEYTHYVEGPRSNPQRLQLKASQVASDVKYHLSAHLQ